MNERIKALCNENGITFAALEKRLGMGNATMKKANEKIQAIRLKKIADFFGVTMEYLLTGAETPQDVLSKQERELLHLFRRFSPEGQIEILKRISELSTLPQYLKKDADESGSIQEVS